MPASAPGFTLRFALASDASAIRALIRQVQINPTGLDWHRFLIAVDAQGTLVACGQLKPHTDGTQELASIAVLPEWRGQGVARAIILSLVRQHQEQSGPAPLYLTCRSSLSGFYARFGFILIDEPEMPPYFRRIHRLFRWFERVNPGGESLSVMRRQSDLEPGQGPGRMPM